MRLDTYTAGDFDRGASRVTELLWLIASALMVETWLPGSVWRVRILRFFGAEIGVGVIIKPHIRIKFPWRLRVGEYSWLGEQVWIDNLAEVKIGPHACISQGAYLCTGSHNWSSDRFDLVVKPIHIGRNAWVGAQCRVAPGTVLGEGAVLGMGSVAKGELKAWMIHVGHYAEPVMSRRRE